MAWENLRAVFGLEPYTDEMHAKVGPQGPMGPKGDWGPKGAPGLDWTDLTPRWTMASEDVDWATMPRPAHEGDAGADLVSRTTQTIPPHETVKFPTGWCVHLHEHTVGDVRSRSSLASRGLVVANSPGTVDVGYTGEVVVAIHNNTDRQQVITAGDRIAQFVVTPVVPAGAPRNNDERGDGGFGSTGTSWDRPESDPLEDIQRTAREMADVSALPRVETLTDVVILSITGRDWVTLEFASGNTVSGHLENPQEKILSIYSPFTADRALDREDPTDDEDVVNHPAHYENHPIFNGEAFTYLHTLTPAQYAAGKYIWRAGRKGCGTARQDLEKSIWYLERGDSDNLLGNPPRVRLDVTNPALFAQLDADLTMAEEFVLEDDPENSTFTAVELYLGMAFLETVRGNYARAVHNVRSALEKLPEE